MRKGQGRKPTIEPSVGIVWETIMLSWWVWEYFGKSLSLNTVRRCIKKCNLKLYYAKRKAFMNFSRTMPGLILHELQQRGFIGIECVCLTGLPAVRSVSYWKCMAHHEEENQITTVEQLKSCIHKEWAKIPLAKLQQLISSVPQQLQSVIKRKGDITQW